VDDTRRRPTIRFASTRHSLTDITGVLAFAHDPAAGWPARDAELEAVPHAIIA
jgi:hypothetical protein